jgi:hypothetical protein
MMESRGPVEGIEAVQKGDAPKIWSLRHEIAEREWQSMRPMVDHFSVELLSGGMSVPYTETISWFVGFGVQKIWDPGIVLGARLYYAPLETDLVREKRPDVWEQYSENYGAFEFQLGTAWQARWGPVPIQWDGALLFGSLFRDRAGYEGWGSRGYIGLLSSLSYEWFYLQGSPKWHRDGTEVALGAGLRWRWN